MNILYNLTSYKPDVAKMIKNYMLSRYDCFNFD